MTLILLWTASVARADTCEDYGSPESVTVADAPVTESSGLAASLTRPGVLFTHDDDGDPVVYAVDLDGRYLGSHRVPGATLEDWEDVASGPCPRDGEPCLYVADIGDNDAVRTSITVYVAREPEEPGADADRLDTWRGSYPDGPRDAETLLVHPCTGDVYVLTKRDGGATVYRWPTEREGATLERITDIALDDDGPVTGGHFDQDGDRLVLRTRDRLWGWSVDPADPDRHWGDAPALLAEVDEEQGEGVAFALDGALLTSDEGHPLRLHRFPCEAEAPAAGACRFTPVRGCGCGGGPGHVGAWSVAAGLFGAFGRARSRRPRGSRRAFFGAGGRRRR